MITLNGKQVRVIASDNGLVSVRYIESDRIRCVSLRRLRGTTGGDLELATVIREANARAKKLEVET